MRKFPIPLRGIELDFLLAAVIRQTENNGGYSRKSRVQKKSFNPSFYLCVISDDKL